MSKVCEIIEVERGGVCIEIEQRTPSIVEVDSVRTIIEIEEKCGRIVEIEGPPVPGIQVQVDQPITKIIEIPRKIVEVVISEKEVIISDPGNGGGLKRFFTVVTNAFVITNQDVIFVDPVSIGDNVTITLPPAASRIEGVFLRELVIKNYSTDNTNRVTLLADDGEFVEGVAQINLNRGEGVQLFPRDNTNWSIA